MKKLGIVFALSFGLVCCDTAKQKTKETLNEGGELVGKAATEIAQGISDGVQKTLDCEITLSSELGLKGIKKGNFYIGQDSSGGVHNVLRLYLIFDQPFDGTILAKLFTQNGLECGRSKLKVSGVSGDAKYFDFAFDKRTHIESKSIITLE